MEFWWNLKGSFSCELKIILADLLKSAGICYLHGIFAEFFFAIISEWALCMLSVHARYSCIFSLLLMAYLSFCSNIKCALKGAFHR